MIKVKTENQLKVEWGKKRFEEAIDILSGWQLDKQYPIKKEDEEDLMKQSEDAFGLFVSRTYYQALDEALARFITP